MQIVNLYGDFELWELSNIAFYQMANELCWNFLKDSDYSATINKDALKISGSFENNSLHFYVLCYILKIIN